MKVLFNFPRSFIKMMLHKRHILSTFLYAVILIGSGALYSQDMFSCRQLSFEPAQEGFPTWSPDSRFIVYQYVDLYDTSGQNGLWKMTAEGTEPEHIHTGVAEHPCWSPDGRFIVFDADTGQTMRMIPASGGKAISFLPDSIQITHGGLPCWSPDGGKIAFKDSRYSLCIYDLKSAITKRVFSQKGMKVLPGCWSKDGQYVLIALMDPQTRKSILWKIAVDGRDNEQVMVPDENFYRYMELSPDGSLLIYGAMRGRHLGMYVMPLQGGKAFPLSVTPGAHNEGPSWSPDGNRIAFISTRAGSFDIWMMDINMQQMQHKVQEGQL